MRTYTVDGERIIMRKPMHQTRDGVTDAQAQEYELVRVRPDAVLGCKCGDGKCEPKHCDEVYAMKDGTRFATFHGLGLQGRKMSDGATSIYRIASATRDEDRLFQLRDALIELNKKNADFWAVSDPEGASQ
jgi:hypothetical protein